MKDDISVFLASDHAGYDARLEIVEYLKSLAYSVVDLGCDTRDSVDYPDYAHKLANALKENPGNFGILLCGSGIGISIAVNRYPHIRGALCGDVESAQLSRAHNDANVLCLGARTTDMSTMRRTIFVFLNTGFECGRHIRRIEKMSGDYGYAPPPTGEDDGKNI